MKRNEFYKDASLLFKKVSKQIVGNQLEDECSVIENTLLFAIGVEKLLKSIIYDVNPLYVLESPDFKNSAPIAYYADIKDNCEVAKDPNEDVIAFHSSVLRATVFSKTAFDNKNTLMKLKNARDIIVHHNFSKLDIYELRTLLKRDFYPLLRDFSVEHSFGGMLNFFNNLNPKLASISSSLQDDIEKQIKLKLEGVTASWNALKGVNTFNIKKVEVETAKSLEKDYVFPAECPCCKNQALVYTTPIMSFDSYKNEIIQTGLSTKALKCLFCHLEVTDYKELDYLKIMPNIKDKESILETYLGATDCEAVKEA